MSGLEELYSELIVDHSVRPHNFKRLQAPPAISLEAFNPLCGDRFTLYLELDEAVKRVNKLTFEGSGCAISTASISILTDLVLGKNASEVREIVKLFTQLMTGKVAPSDLVKLGKAAALEEVKNYPMRIKCATLGWHALEELLIAN